MIPDTTTNPMSTSLLSQLINPDDDCCEFHKTYNATAIYTELLHVHNVNKLDY